MIGLEFEQAILLIHAGATWFMVGLIWFVQVVHYPGFGAISDAGFVDYSRAHVQRTGWVVGPPMLVELAPTHDELADNDHLNNPNSY